MSRSSILGAKKVNRTAAMGRAALLVRSCVSCAAIMAQVQVSVAAINETTDRYRWDQLACKLSTDDSLKPEFLGLDFVRADNTNFGYADLTGDGNPEFITGASDESYDPRDGRYFSDNYSRSRRPHQYSFYSTDSNFKLPSGTRFLMARTILTQDFNGDGRDDVVFVQHGPDYHPYEPRRNEILLSGDRGYSASYLPGQASLFHGGAAGDVDGDGDVDILVTPGPRNAVLLYRNNGSGEFTVESVIEGFGRNYNIKLWDIDGDGALDVFLDGHAEPLRLFLGNGDGTFASPRIVSGFDAASLMQDMAFSEGAVGEAVVLASILTESEFPYDGFSLTKIRMMEDGPALDFEIDRVEAKFFWLARINACDLLSDGDIDYVYEVFGEPSGLASRMPTYAYLDKIVWENVGNTFRRVPIEAERTYMANPSVRWELRSFARSVGVSTVRYQARQTYFPRAAGLEYARHPIFIEPFVPWFLQDANTRHVTSRPHTIQDVRRWQSDGNRYVPRPSEMKANNPTEVSPRVKEIIDARRGVVSAVPLEVPESVSRPNDPSQVSPRVRAIIDARRNSP